MEKFEWSEEIEELEELLDRYKSAICSEIEYENHRSYGVCCVQAREDTEEFARAALVKYVRERIEPKPDEPCCGNCVKRTCEICRYTVNEHDEPCDVYEREVPR